MGAVRGAECGDVIRSTIHFFSDPTSPRRQKFRVTRDGVILRSSVDLRAHC